MTKQGNHKKNNTEMNTLDLKQLFKSNVCSFEMAKKMKEDGMTCQNTFFVYDDHGEVADAGWLESLGYNYFYPCINLALAIRMMESLPIQHEKIELWQIQEGPTLPAFYYLKYDGGQADSSENLVDLLLTFYLKHNKS